MSYCQLEDINDTLLKKTIVQEDIDESTKYIDAIALTFNLPDGIDNPPFEIKQLAIAYTCMRRALYLSGKPVNGDADAYELKRKAYEKDVAKWESKLTLELLVGSKQSRRSYFNMTMKRC